MKKFTIEINYIEILKDLGFVALGAIIVLAILAFLFRNFKAY